MEAQFGRPLASIVIPAHNEERTIGRLMAALQNSDRPEVQFEVIVVCNGCIDETPEVVRRELPTATVLETDIPSKKNALKMGDEIATVFPRLFVDADVEISADDILKLLKPLQSGAARASAPERVLPRKGVSRWVRWYYDVWEALPQVRNGLFGRGVVALNEAGSARVRLLPEVMSDDLAMSEAFSAEERTIVVGSHVIIRPPKTMRDLIRRRIRVATGNAEADHVGLRGASARTSPKALLELAYRQPSLIPRIPLFVGLAVVARVQARRAVSKGDFTTWRRDESSREE
jgi:hypothetical protein